MSSNWKYLGDQSEEDFLAEARDRFHEGLDADAEDRAEALDDVRMVAGGEGQWDQEIVKYRKGDGTRPPRPVLSWNRLRVPVYQVVNDGRMNKPGILVSPMDSGDPDTAEQYFQPRIRQIEYETDADIAYDTARQQAVTSGRGFIRVRTAYKSHKSFEQTVHIDEIPNQFSVIVDPNAKEYDRQDAEWIFIDSIVSANSYRRKHGEDAFERYTGFWDSYDGSFASEWFNGNQCHEVEYWVKQYTPDTLMLFKSGDEFLRSELPAGTDFEAMGLERKRQVQVPRVVQYIIDGTRIVSETLWIGSTIPIVPHWGDQMVVDGKRKTFSLVRDSKDPQKVINLTVSHIAELTANIQKTKYAVAEGQIAGHEAEWMPNSPFLYKQYKTRDATGRELPPPVPDQSEPPIQALSMQLAQAIDATKSGTGIFDAAMGAKSNETSGKAINARKLESDVSTFHFHDNESRTRKAIGRILVEIIPLIDQGKEEVPVRTEDGKTKVIPIGKPFKTDKGKEVTVRPSSPMGYGIAVKTGPSYTSQREQAFDTYSEIAKGDQNFMAIAGDLLFRNLDAPGAEQIADRYEQAVIPPEVRPDKEQNLPPAAKAEMTKLQQQIEQMTQIGQALGEKCQALEAQLASKQAEIESKEKIAMLQEETKRTIALADREAMVGIELLKQEIARLRTDMEQQNRDRENMIRMSEQAQVQGEKPQAPAPQAAPAQPPVAAQPLQGDVAPPEATPIPQEETQ